ncbi:MAG: CemA family protein [Calothrix sp. MO_192.B10]|nr:CemA family protein [Calothrix sp. MO_192.B10]
MNNRDVRQDSDSSFSNENEVKPASVKRGIIPGSIGRTFKKIVRELKPGAERKYVTSFHVSRNRTRITVRFLAILIIVPLLTQSLSKNFLITPIIRLFYGEHQHQVFLNTKLEESAIKELRDFESKLKFEQLLLQDSPVDTDNINREIKEKARKLSTKYRRKSINAVSNVCADILSLITFAVVIFKSQREIAIASSFMDEIVYGLSDSAKAFLIILLTDMFVGFHSPHGWEVIIQDLSDHLGIVSDKNTMGLFIATFPVILDTIFKYWIFRYLSRLSPSALATFKEMNE